MKKIYAVKVTWDDSTGSGGWHYSADVRDDPPKPSHCVSVGYLLEERKKSITLAMSISEETNQVQHLLTIPRVAVLSVEKL